MTKREKRACLCCEQGRVTAAPVPARIIDKGLVSDRVVIDTVVSKYSDHLPLYRQSAILERETGLEISRAALDGWVLRVGELLRPIAAVIGRELIGGSYIQADVSIHRLAGLTPAAWAAKNRQPDLALQVNHGVGLAPPVERT